MYIIGMLYIQCLFTIRAIYYTNTKTDVYTSINANPA